MRRDRIFRQPNVMRAATDQTRQVDSTAILHALAGEVARIRTENPQLTREQDTALSEMENALAERGFAVSAASTERPGGNPTEMGYVNGSAITSVNASANASAEVLGERGGLQTVGSDSPSPIPLFPANPAVASLPSGSRSKRLDSARRRIPADFNVTDEMLKWARDNTPLVGKVETAQFVDWHLGAGSTKADWPATWRAWMRRAQAEAEQRLARASPVLPQTQGPGHKLFRPEDHD